MKGFEKNSLLTYLLTYLSNNNNNYNYNYTTRVNKETVEEFHETCKKLGLLKKNRYSNVALEGLMHFFIEQYKDSPRILQTNLTFLFNKPEQVNIAKKITVKKPQQKHHDYSELSLEDLEKQYLKAKERNEVATIQILAYELKKRGIDLRSLRKRVLRT